MRSIIPLFTTAIMAAAPAIAAESLPVASFRNVELRGGGDVTLRPGPVQRVTIVEGSSAVTEAHVDRDGTLRVDACNGRCPRNYRLRIEIQSPRLPGVAIKGGGAIRATGGFPSERHVAAAIDGGGAIDLRAVSASNASAAVNGGGEILLATRSHLTAAVNGGGNIRYWGNPQVTMAVRGGGSVDRAN